MAEPWLSTGEKLTEFFSSDQIEASARRTKFVQRASKITGKVFLALVSFGRWSAPKTTVAQLAAKAAQLDAPVTIPPEAVQPRMKRRQLLRCCMRPLPNINRSTQRKLLPLLLLPSLRSNSVGMKDRSGRS